MQVAIDKTCLKYLDKVKGNELVYIFDNEPLEELLKLNMHCVHKSKINEVEINASNFKLNAIKTVNLANISELEIPKKKDYEFCIIIPNYNNAHGNIEGKTFLQKCIESVLNQTYKNFKIIVVDDMSNDTSVETVENYVEKDKRVHLIRNNRKRYNGGSRNVGIEYAMNNLDFDYFAFLDSDDWYKDENVLKKINDNLWDCELMLLGLEMIFPDGTTQTKINEYDNYKDFFICDNKTWCTAWSRVIRKDKIVYFPENTLMEDRTWAYEQADNVSIENVRNLKEVCYVWNRLNTTNSVSLKRGNMWEASMWKHIGEQYMLLERLKHKEMIPVLEERIKQCRIKVNIGEYQQY
ncbi:MAG: glycosyltransferase family 2 protein [Clostridia bacterium]